MTYVQEPPFAVQIELAEGCNLRCTFCGLQGIREKAGGPYKCLSTGHARVIAMSMHNAGWTSRVEFAMHGEPTMNPHFVEIVSIFRERLPNNQLMMTSNGGGLLRDPVGLTTALFEAGLNVLALDDYQTVKIVPKIRDKIRPYKYVGSTEPKMEFSYIAQMYDYPKDGLDITPHRRWPKGTKVVIFVEDIEKATKGGHSVLNNHCGAGAPPNDDGAGKRCAKPFRELSVRWDGSVACCCNDWRGVYKIGNVTKNPIDKLWQNERMRALRRKLYHGQRDFGACKGCDATSYRVGLLPDKLGKVKLPKPNADDLRAIAQATAGRPYTKPVNRPWEV